MNHYRATIAYLGTPYFGFKRTAMGPSVQGELERSLEQILRHQVTVEGASLTDRGVHAEGQVIQFSSPRKMDPYRLLGSLRSLLPKDVAPLELEMVGQSFHPSLDATHKEYHYTISNLPSQLPFDREFAWHLPLPLDLLKMEEAIPSLLGERDFSAFSNESYDDPRRNLMEIGISSETKGKVQLVVIGDRFLYKMVRNLVGTLAWVGLGRIPSAAIPAVLESGDRKQAGPAAPAHGLTLKRVYY